MVRKSGRVNLLTSLKSGIEFYKPCDARSIGGGGCGRRAPQVGELHDGEQGELTWVKLKNCW